MLGKERIRATQVAELLRGKLDLPRSAHDRITEAGPTIGRIMEMIVATIGVLTAKGTAPIVAQSVLARLEEDSHVAVDAMLEICRRVAAMDARDTYDRQLRTIGLLGLWVGISDPVDITVTRKATGSPEHLAVSRRSDEIRFAADIAGDMEMHLPRISRIMADRMQASGDEQHADIEATATALRQSADILSRDPVNPKYQISGGSVHGPSSLQLRMTEIACLTDEEVRQRVHTPDRTYIAKSRRDLQIIERLVDGYQSIIDEAGLPGTVFVKGGYNGHYGIYVDAYGDDLNRKGETLHWGKVDAFDGLLDISAFCRKQSALHQRRITGVLKDLTTWVFDAPLLRFVDANAEDPETALLALLANGPGTVKPKALRQAFGKSADGIRNMKLSMNGNHIGARLPINDSIDWANGHVSIRRTTLPVTVLNALDSLKGMPLENIIVHPWLPADAEILDVNVSATAEMRHRPTTDTLTVKVANDPQPYVPKAA